MLLEMVLLELNPHLRFSRSCLSRPPPPPSRHRGSQTRVLPTKKKSGTGGHQYDDDDGVGGDATAGFQKALCVVDLESRLDVGGEVIETVLSVLEGEAYQ